MVQDTRQTRLPWVATFVLGLFIAGGAAWILKPTIPGSVVRFSFTSPAEFPLETTPNRSDVAISPDGNRIVYTLNDDDGSRLLYMRRLDLLNSSQLLDLRETTNPFFSPDGSRVGFGVNSDNTLRWVSIQGGPSSTIVDLGGVLRGASWGPDGTIVYATGGGGLMQVSEAGGEPRPLTEPEGSMTHWWPEFLPNGRGAVVSDRFRTSRS